MRSQLQTFTDYTNTLLPHETEYLLSIQQFKDEQRLQILQLVDYNAQHIGQFTPYDTSIDKRKYNHLQNWITGRLQAADVDANFRWMLDMEQLIMTDSIQMEDEKQLLRSIRNYVHPGFFFVKFYELVEHYRHFLLIRLRYADHQLADAFLQEYRAAYQATRDVQERLHRATLDIVQQYSGHRTGSKQWEDWLTTVFYDDVIEGHMRYMALVRLTFIAHNHREYDPLREKFDYLDQQFREGRYYSKRLLLNYYNNRLMLHSNFREYDRAIRYGYLSIRAKTHDHLLYVNNLCAVLMRQERNQEALELMKKAAPEAKQTKNFHNRVGYVAFYMEALNKNGLYKNAVNYGSTFLKAYTQEILQYRWHLFFSVYLESMLHRGQFEEVLRTIRKYKLRELDEGYRATASYLPVIPLYYEAARYKKGLLSRDRFIALLQEFAERYQRLPEKKEPFRKLLRKTQDWLTEVRAWLG